MILVRFKRSSAGHFGIHYPSFIFIRYRSSFGALLLPAVTRGILTYLRKFGRTPWLWRKTRRKEKHCISPISLFLAHGSIYTVGNKNDAEEFRKYDPFYCSVSSRDHCRGTYLLHHKILRSLVWAISCFFFSLMLSMPLNI